MNTNPFKIFEEWINEAKSNPGIKDATVVCLATCYDNKPSNRIVLLKQFDERGFAFFTNKQSKKGTQLTQNPFAAMCFYWDEIGKQVRVEGNITEVTEEESDIYYNSRSLDSRIGAIASKQSQKLESREVLLKDFDDVKNSIDSSGPKRPQHWGGFRLAPERIEFWIDRPHRLHDRTLYSKNKNNEWEIIKLYP